MVTLQQQIEQERQRRTGLKNIGKNLLIGAASALAPVTGGLSLAAIPVIKGLEYATNREYEKPQGFGEYAMDFAQDTVPAVVGYGVTSYADKLKNASELAKLAGTLPVGEKGMYIPKSAKTHEQGGVNVNVEAGEVIIPENMQNYIDAALTEEEKAKRYEQVMAMLKSQPLTSGDQARYGGIGDPPYSEIANKTLSMLNTQTKEKDNIMAYLKSLSSQSGGIGFSSKVPPSTSGDQAQSGGIGDSPVLINTDIFPSAPLTTPPILPEKYTGTPEKYTGTPEGTKPPTIEEKLARLNKQIRTNQRILSGIQAGVAGASLLQNAFSKDSEKLTPELIEPEIIKSPLTETQNMYNRSLTSDRNMLYKSLRERGADTSTMLGVHANIADARSKHSAELGKLQKEHETIQSQLNLNVKQVNAGAINQAKQFNIQKQMAENAARTEANKGNWLGMINALGNIYDVDAELAKQGMTRDYLFKLLEDNKNNPNVVARIVEGFFKQIS